MRALKLTMDRVRAGEDGYIAGWGRIADFLNRTERSCRRDQYDAANPLPVEGNPDHRGGVRAKASELAAWLERHCRRHGKRVLRWGVVRFRSARTARPVAAEQVGLWAA